MNHLAPNEEKFAVGMYDDARIFPLLRDYFHATSTASTRLEIDKAFSNDKLIMARNESPEVFETWVDQANRLALATEKVQC